MFERQSGLLVPGTNLLDMRVVGQTEALDIWYQQSQGNVFPGRKLVVIFEPGMRRGGVTTGALSGLLTEGFKPSGAQALVGSSVGGTIAREYAGENLDALKALFIDDRRPNPDGQRMIFLDKKKSALSGFRRN
ncbi:MAG TPA: hypothetical protein VJG66_02715 [Patescibacteria group bacterium]|nr:hypothetical protein [Patescibacteria group bacterium]